MPKPLHISIKKPCSEDFGSFAPTTGGGFCNSCGKEVIDFTQMSDKELYQFFREANKKTCGRFRTSQMRALTAPRAATPSLSAVVAAAVGIITTFVALPAKAAFKAAPVPKAAFVNIAVSDDELLHKPISPPDTARQITGRVLFKETHAPLPGVNIILNGTSIGTSTDSTGVFTLVIPKSEYDHTTLTFIFIGLATLEKEIDKSQVSSIGDIVMEMGDIQMSGEVVVVRQWSPRGIWHKLTNLFR